MEPEFPDAPVLPSAPPVEPVDELAYEPEPRRPRRGGTADTALPWFLAALIALLLASAGGLIAAWVVASLKAVPIPAGAIVTASPRPGQTVPASGEPTPLLSEQPRHTPTPSPQVTVQPAPFIHVVERGEYLSYIADLYGVTVEEIIELNDIQNPNNIRLGRELLIPGYGIRPSPSP